VKLGFKQLEFGFPSHSDIDAIAEARLEHGVEVVLFNQDVPVWDAQNRGYLVDPSRRDEFKSTLDNALKIVERLDVQKVMLPAGVELEELPREAQRECLFENLEYAAPLAESAGTIFTLEMLNPQDNPGYFLTSSKEAIELVRSFNHPRIRFQFDTYHLQLMEGHLIETLHEAQDVLGHIQFADYPGRHEPGTGEIDFKKLAAAADKIGYQGAIGLEYVPLQEGEDALAWSVNFDH
jgi:hydroxypyruvate isomerase